MRRKGIITLALSISLTLASAFSSLAGEWRLDSKGWWWQEENWYPTSQWMFINGKEYYFDATGYMLHDTVQDGFQLDSSGARVIPDIGLEVAPYKAGLDSMIANNLDYYNGTKSTFGFTTDGKGEWIDAGDYYIIKNTVIGYWYDDYENGSISYVDLCSFRDIYVRKDGNYIYADQRYKLDDWKDNIFLPRGNIYFDSKGYIVGWNDGGAS